MKVAVVGATGNAGTRIVKELVSRGHAVTALSRNADTADLPAGVTPRTVRTYSPPAPKRLTRAGSLDFTSTDFSTTTTLPPATRKSGSTSVR